MRKSTRPRSTKLANAESEKVRIVLRVLEIASSRRLMLSQVEAFSNTRNTILTFSLSALASFVLLGLVLFLIHRDIVQRKKVAETMRESEGRFTAFMDNSPQVAWMKDKDWRYVYINKTFEHMFRLR